MLLSFMILLCSTWTVFSQEINPKEIINAKQLEGIWTIDLRPTPDASPYLMDVKIELIDNKSFTGAFYGSPIESGLINCNWEKLYFAFITKDQSNDYYHSAYLLDNKIYGTTFCPNRGFISKWEGIKKK